MGCCESQPTEHKTSRLTSKARTAAVATTESAESGARAHLPLADGPLSPDPPAASPAAGASRRLTAPLFTHLPGGSNSFESQGGQERDLRTLPVVITMSSEEALPPAYHSASRTSTLSLSGASHQRTQDTSLVAQMGGSAADALSFVSDATSGMEWSGQFTSIPLVALECEGGQRVR